MKLMGDMVKLNYFRSTPKFNYKKYIAPRFYNSTMYMEWEDSATIYVAMNEPIIKGYFEENKGEILLEIQKFNKNIKELKIENDRKGAIKLRNDKLSKIKEIEDKLQDEAKKSIPMSSEKALEIYSMIDNISLDDDVRKYVKLLADMYIINYDESQEECILCHDRFTYTFDGKCSSCIQEEYKHNFENAVSDLRKDPLIVNNSSVYVDAREYLCSKIEDKIYSIYDKSKDKKNLLIPDLFKEYALMKTGSTELTLIRIYAEKLRERVLRYYEEKNGNI